MSFILNFPQCLIWWTGDICCIQYHHLAAVQDHRFLLLGVYWTQQEQGTTVGRSRRYPLQIHHDWHIIFCVQPLHTYLPSKAALYLFSRYTTTCILDSPQCPIKCCCIISCTIVLMHPKGSINQSLYTTGRVHAERDILDVAEKGIDNLTNIFT
jgi:hypothetical protein